MPKTLLLALTFLVSAPLLFAQKAAPVTVKMEHYTAKKCVKKESCAEFSLSWPVLSGGSAPGIKAINDSIRAVVYLAAEADPALSLPRALDTAAQSAYEMLREQLATAEGFEIGYSYELKSKTLLNDGRHFSLEMSNYAFTGGAHGNYYTLLTTYDLNTGQIVPLKAIISDTLALRPLLEKAFVAQKKQEGEPTPQLSELLFEDFKHLPMPANYAVTRQGVRFIYNPYEVAAYAVGQTDITLTWTQLGRLADRKKWGL